MSLNNVPWETLELSFGGHLVNEKVFPPRVAIPLTISVAVCEPHSTEHVRHQVDNLQRHIFKLLQIRPEDADVQQNKSVVRNVRRKKFDHARCGELSASSAASSDSKAAFPLVAAIIQGASVLRGGEVNRIGWKDDLESYRPAEQSSSGPSLCTQYQIYNDVTSQRLRQIIVLRCFVTPTDCDRRAMSSEQLCRHRKLAGVITGITDRLSHKAGASRENVCAALAASSPTTFTAAMRSVRRLKDVSHAAEAISAVLNRPEHQDIWAHIPRNLCLEPSTLITDNDPQYSTRAPPCRQSPTVKAESRPSPARPRASSRGSDAAAPDLCAPAAADEASEQRPDGREGREASRPHVAHVDLVVSPPGSSTSNIDASPTSHARTAPQIATGGRCNMDVLRPPRARLPPRQGTELDSGGMLPRDSNDAVNQQESEFNLFDDPYRGSASSTISDASCGTRDHHGLKWSPKSPWGKGEIVGGQRFEFVRSPEPIQ